MADRYHGEVSANPSSSTNVDLEGGDPRTRISVAEPLGGHKKKATSFQITSVTVQGNRMSNDGGDDSADDLDESHTEDLSSDILDCSKTTPDNGEDLSSASSIAAFSLNRPIDVPPVFPESSSVAGNAQTSQEPAPDHWQHRFKIVKLANSEPFKRGRWLCMDFTDPPHNEQKPEPVTEAHVPSEAASAPCSVTAISAENVSIDRPNSVAHIYEFSVNHPAVSSPAVAPQLTTQPIYGFIVPVSSAVVSSVATAVQTAGDSSKMVYNGQVLQPQVHPAQISHQLTVVPQTTSNVSQLQPAIGQPIVGLPVVSAPDLIRKPEIASIPSHMSLLQANNPADVSGLRSLANPSPLLEVLPDTLSTKSAQEGDDVESSSGSNTVAIDNKIEQAMDLVKSHLMFAVREEVDVLKERITELVDYINRLEQENSILKANASSETLSLLGQLTAPTPVQMSQTQMVSSQHSTQHTQTTS